MFKFLVHPPSFVSALLTDRTLKWAQLVILLSLSPFLQRYSSLAKAPVMGSMQWAAKGLETWLHSQSWQWEV